MIVRSRDLRWPLQERTLEELEYLLTEVGCSEVQRFGWRNVALELLRRLKEKQL